MTAHEYSSPACSLHEVSDAYRGFATSPGWDAVRDWRKRTRDNLLQRRIELGASVHRAFGKRACAQLRQAIDLKAFDVLGIYWPIRGEFDLRSVAKQHLARGGRVALPVVVEKSAPVEFWGWRPGIPMRTGIWNIPIPKLRDVLIPDTVIAPLVGFDSSGFRLGYGGGYYDRTLAAMSPRPYTIGIGYEEAMLPTIQPQAHDIPMDVIVTEQAIRRISKAPSGIAPSCP